MNRLVPSIRRGWSRGSASSLYYSSSPLVLSSRIAPQNTPSNSVQPSSLLSTTRRKLRDRERAQKFSAKQKGQDDSSLPLFSTLMKKLYMKSHPDLLRAVSEEKATVNDASMQIINGILSTVKENKEFPVASTQSIPFYVRNGTEYDLMELRIRTGGGDCRHQLAACFEDFFARTGIHDGRFNWGNDYFVDLTSLEVLQQELEKQEAKSE